MKQQRIRIIPLGGLDEIGRNMTVVEVGPDIVVVDSGLMFPKEEMLGVDLVIPDITYLLENRARVRGIVLTHGHEDHVGALPYVLTRLNVPVHGTRLTLGLVEGKLREHRLLEQTTLHEVERGGRVQLGGINVEFIPVTHSIPDASALALRTSAGMVVCSGDYKIDPAGAGDLGRLAALGAEGVRLLLGDSTNAERAGTTPPESVVERAFRDVFAQAEGRIIIATFASNIYRLELAIRVAASFGRKVAVVGRSMLNNLDVSQRLGYLTVPPGTLIPIEDVNSHADGQVAILTTGSQGEPLSALTKMATQEHRSVKIKQGDTVVISATPIPGNEELVHRNINNLYKLGAEVRYSVTDRVHVSGHASQEELKLLIGLLKPHFVMPVHGEFRMLMHHAKLAQSMGIPGERVILAENGSVVELQQDTFNIVGQVPGGYVFVDGLGVGDVGTVVLRDRRLLAEDGIVVVVVTVNQENGRVLAGPDIISRGFVHVGTSEDILAGAREHVIKNLRSLDRTSPGTPSKHAAVEWAAFKNQIRDSLSHYFYDRTRRRPMVIPVVMEV